MRARRWRDRLKAEWLLLAFALLTLALALADPQPIAAWRRWLQGPTLAGLAGLLIAIQGIRDSAMVQHVAALLVARAHSLRSLGLLLVTATALLSMVLTNDVSLFVLVPLTVVIGGLSNLPVLRMVVLEALAVNAGSTLSPIGSPQNLLLWQHGQLSFLGFAWAMAPAAVMMFALVAALTWIWLPRDRVALAPQALDRQSVARGLAALSTIALAAMVVLMEYGHAALGAGVLLLVFVLAAPRSLARVDWLLLLTFAAIFLGLGHLAELPAVNATLDRLDFSQPLTLYLSGIIASQLISNVPATVLLLERAHDPITLAIAVNVGGFGLAIGSLANLIALRLARQPHGLRALHQASVPFLLVSAPLVYLAWRWLG
ncbi:hypothetical protein J7I44_10095 [Frateuria sp. MAH-13]|uniref:Citrate transporter-like domain-containing protein n=1 Tax=Frateuria flava TaxID=2821489 RepID=A0ABS4DNM0_9GAMM|nr:SLC13 family permease [Frateuria flava]MBP1474652.1 hypothetical protein [Frateuria flava]